MFGASGGTPDMGAAGPDGMPPDAGNEPTQGTPPPPPPAGGATGSPEPVQPPEGK